MVCGNLPRDNGRVGLCYLLSERGSVLAEATVVRLGEDRYWYGSAAAAEWHDRDWLRRYMPDGVTLTEMAGTHTTLVLAGPRSRELLQAVAPRDDFSTEGFPWLRARPVHIGHAAALAMSVSYSGESAFELHIRNEQLLLAWRILVQAGQSFGLSHFGLYAAESMRLEKGYRHWKADLLIEFNPLEAGLGRFVRLDKPDFVGREALLRQVERGPRRLFTALNVDCSDAPAHAGDPVCLDGRQVGSITSGGWGHRLGRNIALAYVEPDCAAPGTRLAVGILGDEHPAVTVAPCQYDPENHRVRR